MNIDLTAYGIGLGLVMCGWIAGMVASYAFSAARGIGRLG